MPVCSRIHRVAVAVDDVVVEGVLEVALAPFDAVQPGDVGLVLAEQQLGVAFARRSDSRPARDGEPRRLPRAGGASAAACASPAFQDQVLRNQSCGSTCSARRVRAAIVDA